MDIPAELRNCGLKATLPRLRILSLFQERPSKHMTADDVFHVLYRERIEVGIATAYRVLMQFVEPGILLRSQLDSSMAVFELNQGTHHEHPICTSCGNMEEFFDSQKKASHRTLTPSIRRARLASM